MTEEKCTLCGHGSEDAELTSWLMGGRENWLCDDCIDIIGINWVLITDTRRILALIKERCEEKEDCKNYPHRCVECEPDHDYYEEKEAEG